VCVNFNYLCFYFGLTYALGKKLKLGFPFFLICKLYLIEVSSWTLPQVHWLKMTRHIWKILVVNCEHVQLGRSNSRKAVNDVNSEYLRYGCKLLDGRIQREAYL
jgi:hypothetical protein